jgi:putative flippase GtrA
VTSLRHYVLVRHRANWGLLARFSVVGASGVVVNLLVFGLLLRTGTEPQNIALPIPGTVFNVRWYHAFSTLAFLTANLWNFQLNRTWTFRSAGEAPWSREYGPFLTVGLAAQALGLLVLTSLLHPHSPASLPAELLDGSSILRNRELWAQALTIGVVTPVSFVGNKLWSFRAVRHVSRRARRPEHRTDRAAAYAMGKESPRP